MKDYVDHNCFNKIKCFSHKTKDECIYVYMEHNRKWRSMERRSGSQAENQK